MKKIVIIILFSAFVFCGCGRGMSPAVTESAEIVTESAEIVTESAEIVTGAPTDGVMTETISDTDYKPDPELEYTKRLLAVYYDGLWNSGFTMKDEDIACADIVYYLSVYVSGDDTIELSNNRLTSEMISSAKEINPDLKILVCLVGDNRDGGNGGREFANAVSDDEKRADLCSALRKMILEYGFDGADIDWEYPSDEVDRANEVKFAAALRETLDGMGEGYLLTAAVPSTAWGFDMHDILGLEPYCDYINVMTYDHHINDIETLHHTAPKNDGTGKYQTRGYSNEQTTQIFIDRGVPAGKLLLGCGLYCLEWHDVPEGETHGFDSVGTCAFNHTYHYSDLLSVCRAGAYRRYWDPVACAAWFYSAERKVFLSCDDDESVRVKAELVNRYDNAGLMLFSYATFRGGTLMQSVRAWLDGDITYPASVDWSEYTG